MGTVEPDMGQAGGGPATERDFTLRATGATEGFETGRPFRRSHQKLGFGGAAQVSGSPMRRLWSGAAGDGEERIESPGA